MVRKKKEAPVEVPEVIPADEVSSVIVAPSEKVKPKRTMTPEMLEKLAIARKKALEVKRKLKDNDEEKIKHIQKELDISYYTTRMIFSMILPDDFYYTKKNNVTPDEPVVVIEKSMGIPNRCKK